MSRSLTAWCADRNWAPGGKPAKSRTKEGDRRSNGDLWSWIGDSANLMYGQKVLVVARWILVVSGLLLALLNPVVLGEVKIQVGLILTLAVANFFLHVQLIRNQPSLPWVAYLASAVDVLAITMMVVTSGGGASSLYVFYFPALFAISVAFRPRAGLVLSGAAIGMYSLIASTQYRRRRRGVCRGQDSHDVGSGRLRDVVPKDRG